MEKEKVLLDLEYEFICDFIKFKVQSQELCNIC